MRKLQILIADDSAIVREAIAEYFRIAGHTVIEASTGREAVALTKSNGFDAAILDIQMPEMSGLEAARHIRESHSSLPILALTGSPEMIGPAHRHLFAEILTKPTSVQELTDAVSTYVVQGSTSYTNDYSRFDAVGQRGKSESP